MKRILIEDLPFKHSLFTKIKAHAIGSLYRMNAKSADCYAFSIDKVGQKHMDGTISKGNDWSGGWDWSKNIIDKSAEYILMLDSGHLYKIN